MENSTTVESATSQKEYLGQKEDESASFLSFSVNLRRLTSETTDIRWSTALPEEEKSAVKRRTEKVAAAVSALLGSPHKSFEVPVVSIVGSGGGFRAMTGISGSIIGLQELGILDCCTYFASLSGSTWYLANLYNTRGEDKLKQCSDCLRESCSRMGHKLQAEALWDRIKPFHKESGDHLAFLVDVFAYYLSEVFKMNSEKGGESKKLSHHRDSVQEADLPFPIYTAVHVKHNRETEEFSEWIEFTPYEYGIACYGAFLKIEDFSSFKCKGVVCKKHEEIDLSSLMGIWGSAFGETLEKILERVEGEKKTLIEEVVRKLFHLVKIDKLRPLAATLPNMLKGVTRKGLWESITGLTETSFLETLKSWWVYLRGSATPPAPERKKPDAEVTHKDDVQLQHSHSMILLDGGVAFNDPFPPLLRPERKTDVFIVFDNSWRDHQWTDPFNELKKACDWAKERGYNFPPIDRDVFDQNNLKRFYVFDDPKDPSCPIVLFFPLCNPDVEKEKEKDEPAPGQNEVYPFAKCYETFSTSPLENEDFNRLQELCRKNVHEGAEELKKAIRKKSRAAKE
eukprot:m.42371 g.42371  ORF g.42371 m.42371 type:complete len:568 (+) comp33353_c0_seq3:715-2418(+)